MMLDAMQDRIQYRGIWAGKKKNGGQSRDRSRADGWDGRRRRIFGLIGAGGRRKTRRRYGRPAGGGSRNGSGYAFASGENAGYYRQAE